MKSEGNHIFVYPIYINCHIFPGSANASASSRPSGKGFPSSAWPCSCRRSVVDQPEACHACHVPKTQYPRCHFNACDYYLKVAFTLLIRKTINAATVMIAVTKKNQKQLMLYLWCLSKCIKPYLNISCFDVIVGFCSRFDSSRFVLADVGIANKYARESF